MKKQQSGSGVSPVPAPALPLLSVGQPSCSRCAESRSPLSDQGEIIKKQGYYLPHWTAESAIYHVVFRLADSLPKEVLKSFEVERDDLLKQPNLTSGERERLTYLASKRVEAYLDAGHGNCLMNRPQIADIVMDSILFFEGSRYVLHAWCVMPNHVHLVIEPVTEHQLSSILHSIKSFTSHRINKLTSMSGIVWQKESYDHLIRSELALERALNYVSNNPTEAGLTGWKWVSPQA